RTTASTAQGSTGSVAVPTGRLTDGWKLRWRMRATAAGVNGAWTSWNNLAVDISKPTVNLAYVAPTSDADGKVTSKLTPTFYARHTDPEGRAATFTVEVEHDPAATGQGSGLIWSGTTASTAQGSTGSVAVPTGRLTDGWKLRWRMRATAAGVNGAWTSWNNLTVDTQSGATAAVTAAPDDDRYDRIKDEWECWEHPNRANYRYENGVRINPRGYTRNRFSWCVTYDGVLVRERNRKIIDKVSFPITMIGRTFQGSRFIEYDVLVQTAKVEKGTMFDGRQFTIGMNGTGYPQAHSCRIAPETQASYTGKGGPGEFWWDKKVSFKFESVAEVNPGADNLENVAVCSTRLTLSSPGLYSTEAPHPVQTIRCDSASYIFKGNTGCIFDHMTSSLALKQNQNPNAYSHIYKAFASPNLTVPNSSSPAKAWPTWANRNTPKKFNGFYKADPLHRILPNSSRKASNYYRSAMTCGWHYYPSTFTGKHPYPWVADDKECDEFPFQSTYEGAWIWWQEDRPRDVRSYQAGVNFSVLPIPEDENGRWGGTARGGLGHFYANDRILAEDAFFIRLYDAEGNRMNPDNTPE
ncbi:hypothetical protein, partial [Nonomuraea sp. KM90]|uniref:hypothetical protein n=1 Tax=Nonomuraea sp. KM90 TaxID=3457428 RepID=UPI003FCD042A